MFFLTKKEGNVLCNDALIGHIVKNHSARVLLYAPSHIQDSTCHEALAGMRNSSMGQQ